MNEKFRTDIIMFGSIAGMLANIPKVILTQIFIYCGWLGYGFHHIAAGYYVDAKFLNHPISYATGAIIDFLNAGMLGALLYYVLRRTGADYAEYKGFLFGLLLYMVIFGAFMSLELTEATFLTPLANFLMLFPHILYGVSAAWILKRYGKV